MQWMSVVLDNKVVDRGKLNGNCDVMRFVKERKWEERGGTIKDAQNWENLRKKENFEKIIIF